VGDRQAVPHRDTGLLTVFVGVGSVAVAATGVEAVGDRDWALQGFEWPGAFGIAALLASLAAWVLATRRASVLGGAGRSGVGEVPAAARERTRFGLPTDSELERPGLRWLVSLRRTISISLRRRQLCIVRYRDGISACRYPNGMVIPVAWPRTPERLEADAAVFLRSYRPRPGDVVVDAGAGIGEEVLVFAELVGRRGKVVAIEAHPASFERLATLCRLNRLENVTCVHAALLDEPGTALVTDEKQALKNSVVTDDGVIRVSAETLDSVVGRLGIERVDLLKMNIEGAELRALAGFADGLSRTANVAIACHDRRADRGESDVFRTKAAVRALLASHGLEPIEVGPTENPWDQDYVYGRAPAVGEFSAEQGG
jgi:FkbM family methyltransferase